MSYRVLFLPKRRYVHVEPHTSVLEAGIQARAGIEHKCGGQGSCGTCRVRINPRSPINPPTRIERIKLTERQLREGYRLSCQVSIGSDLEVEVPESPLARVVRLQLEELHRGKQEEELE